MPFVPSDLDVIDAAIKAGAVKVKFQDREIEYNTTDELIKARGLIVNELALQGPPKIVRHVRMFTSKGL